MNVDLSWAEVRIGILNGTERRCRGLYRGRRPRYGATGNWDDDIVGALAELVVAKALNLYPSFGAEPDSTDVGDRFHVRSTTRLDGCLIVHNDDPDDAPFLLVIGTPPSFRIAGWMPGADCKDPQWWRTDVREPAFFVPQRALRHIDELR